MKLQSDIDRRDFLKTGAAVATASLLPSISSASLSGSIDRLALVRRHTVILHQPDPVGVVAVGNGNFAFNADITGLQSFPEYYEKSMPIGIMSNWGWHSFPNPKGYSLENFPDTCWDITRDGKNSKICYPSIDRLVQGVEAGVPEEAEYLRSNPHKFGIGRIGLEITKADGSMAGIADLASIEQKLDIWSGLLTSNFEVEGEPVYVETAVHPLRDEVAIRIRSRLITSQRLKVKIAFAYAPGVWGWAYEDWSHPERHRTSLVWRGSHGADFDRQLDDTRYFVRALWSPGLSLASNGGPDACMLSSFNGADSIELVAWFSPHAIQGETDSVAEVQSASARHWRQFWMSGGAIDLSDTADPRAQELERRLVLSQYVTAVHSSGSLQPQESGLTCNTWFGKFHIEMYWWHCAHFALWGRPALLENSMTELIRILPKAREIARKQGFSGARWPKMIGPEGDQSPSPIAPKLVWQQPHPIYMAELLYRAHPTRATLDKYKDIVFETADFIASFMNWDPEKKQYILGPGIYSADEHHVDLVHNINPTFELGYWRWALQTAQPWRQRLGLPPNAQWDHVLQHMAPLPVQNGAYPVLESVQEPRPSMNATWLYGILPGDGVDLAVMRQTFEELAKFMTTRTPLNFVGTAEPMMAMCAARFGQPDIAVELLVGKYVKNQFMVSGYARGYDEIPVFLPSNGGWLAAAAMMAVGWKGAPSRSAPGFPPHWRVRWEGLQPLL
ncbi:MAG: twin-arginine translocation signal domain-containing protein [Terracidiphilus sp.]|nr:twin-arginine translocation signal domain-containing protein [Terracidiphilus sp.]MDR3796878.1 twin-arginine translocation signal domain-containing protein [Terracidiphilus sp.]